MKAASDSASRIAPWLETIDGPAPILLIAPHGGRSSDTSGAAARAGVSAKVNDLYTAEITRELARRIGAGALINFAMDRNRLDCNRIAQLVERAPWLLDLIARRVAELVRRHERLVVLLIHGWNIIQPRLDLGIGVRQRDGALRVAGSAAISAAEDFINRRLAPLAGLLANRGILATFGMRYPAGGAQNLLQAFTTRHQTSTNGALHELAAIASSGAIDAVQLELSVALRLPGSLRKSTLDAIESVFGRSGPAPQATTTPLSIAKAVSAPSRMPLAAPSAATVRVGIEFHDPSARLGAMASFDIGGGAIGARIMILYGARRVALCTCEGRVETARDRLALGPLELRADGRRIVLSFRGPAVVVPDGANYISIENALDSGALDEQAQVSAELQLPQSLPDLSEVIGRAADAAHSAGPGTAFGAVEGRIAVDGTHYDLDGAGRFGLSFTGLGPARFDSRRMLWACFGGGVESRAVELSIARFGDESQASGRMMTRGQWSRCSIDRLEIESGSPELPPADLSALLTSAGQERLSLTGAPANFVALSRPASPGARIFTTLGFAKFSLDGTPGAGMFELSRRVVPAIEGATSAGDFADED